MTSKWHLVFVLKKFSLYGHVFNISGAMNLVSHTLIQKWKRSLKQVMGAA